MHFFYFYLKIILIKKFGRFYSSLVELCGSWFRTKSFNDFASECMAPRSEFYLTLWWFYKKFLIRDFVKNHILAFIIV